MGIKGRFMALVGVLVLVSVIIIGGASYKFSTSSAMDEAKTKGEIIFNYIDAQRMYFREDQRALVMELVEKDRFYPDLMSGFVVTRATWAKFKQSMPGYLFKQATIDPLHPDNKADENELKIIKHFQDNPGTKRSEGTLEKDGEEYFYLARPISITKKGCLRCHGDPLDAPKDQVDIYGTEHGYNWKMGETPAAFVVYIPVSQAMEAAKKSAAILILIGAGTLLVVLIGISAYITKAVVNPVVMLSNRTEEISLGKNLTDPIAHDSNDEIGMLASSINRLRISLVKILQRVAKK